MTKRLQNQSKTAIIYWTLVCATLLVFFYRIHPMILFDTDDWLYCYAARDMLPQVGLWNPARVLPEVLMPFVSYISAYLFYPVSGDYIMSLALGYAIALTAFIMAYFYLAYCLLRQRLAILQTHALAATTIFIVLHFLVYRTADANNAYTFYSSNVTCVFYYIIPTLLNIILILYCELQGGEVFIKGRYLQNGGYCWESTLQSSPTCSIPASCPYGAASGCSRGLHMRRGSASNSLRTAPATYWSLSCGWSAWHMS